MTLAGRDCRKELKDKQNPSMCGLEHSAQEGRETSNPSSVEVTVGIKVGLRCEFLKLTVDDNVSLCALI